MGRIIRFRSRRWTRSSGYGHRDLRRKVTLRGLARETAGWLGKLRPFILLGIVASIWPAADPALVEPPVFLASEPEKVDQHFSRCGPGRGHACVIDGDTFKLGKRKVRIIGIDAPEVKARCPEEAAKAEAATAELQRLLNQGPFEMVGRIDDRQDRYGRDLRAIRRIRPNGTKQSIAEDMRASGLARRYWGGLKSSWC